MGRSNLSRQKLTVSELARIAGVGPDSIRQYERIGLVPKAERSSAGYRLWAAREVQYLKWVAPAKRAGFTLHELAEIFRMYRAGRAPCRKVQDLLRQKLAYLDRNVDELSALRAQLRGVFVRWEGRLRRASSGEFVPLFDDLREVPFTQPTTALKKQQWRNTMIYALVTFHVQSSKINEFESLHRALAQFISGQPGCIEIKVHRSLKKKDPQEYVVYGAWESKEAWESAHQTTEFKTQFKNLPVEQHTLSSASFFDVAYSYQEGEVALAELM